MKVAGPGTPHAAEAIRLLARHLFEEMGKMVPAPVRVARVAVWESDDARAEFSRPG